MLRQYEVFEAGVTLIEMLVVVSLMAVFVGISFSSLRAGISSLRLKTAASATAAFVTAAENQAERKQEPVDVHVSRDGRTIVTQTLHSGVVGTLELPDGIRIGDPPGEHILLYPGGGAPHVALHLVSETGAGRIVSLEPAN